MYRSTILIYILLQYYIPNGYSSRPTASLPLYGYDSVCGYSVPISVGSTSFLVSFDTGSSALGIVDKRCTSCGLSSETLYQPQAALTTHYYNVTYGVGSWSGYLVYDQITLGNSTAGTGPIQASGYPLIAIQSQSSYGRNPDVFFHPQCRQTGIWGVASNFPYYTSNGYVLPFLDFAISQQSVANQFTIQNCGPMFPPNTPGYDITKSIVGNVWIGGYDPSFLQTGVNFTLAKLITPSSGTDFYRLNISGFSINNISVTLPSTNYLTNLCSTNTTCIMDSGTSYFIVSDPAAYTSIANGLASTDFISFPISANDSDNLAMKTLFWTQPTWIVGRLGSSITVNESASLGVVMQGWSAGGQSNSNNVYMNLNSPWNIIANLSCDYSSCVAQNGSNLPQKLRVSHNITVIDAVCSNSSFNVANEDGIPPCQAFLNFGMIGPNDFINPGPSYIILGTPFLKGRVVLHDRYNGRLGFASGKDCGSRSAPSSSIIPLQPYPDLAVSAGLPTTAIVAIIVGVLVSFVLAGLFYLWKKSSIQAAAEKNQFNKGG